MEEVETMNINSTLGKFHCVHLKLGKPPEMADNWMGTEDQRNNLKKIISNISQCCTASRNRINFEILGISLFWVSFLFEYNVPSLGAQSQNRFGT